MYKTAGKDGFKLILGFTIFPDSEFVIYNKQSTFMIQINCYFVDKF
jgi:hypothetical protein